VTLSDHDLDELEAKMLEPRRHAIPQANILTLIAEIRRLRKIEAAARAIQIERNGWDGSLTINGGNDAVEALRAALTEEGK